MYPLARVCLVDLDRVETEPGAFPNSRLAYLMWCGAELVAPLATDAARFPAPDAATREEGAQKLLRVMDSRSSTIAIALLAQAYGHSRGDHEPAAFIQESQFHVPDYIVEKLGEPGDDLDAFRLNAEQVAIWACLPAEHALLERLDEGDRAARTRDWARVAPRWEKALQM